jgi:hypothetical protein
MFLYSSLPKEIIHDILGYLNIKKHHGQYSQQIDMNRFAHIQLFFQIPKIPTTYRYMAMYADVQLIYLSHYINSIGFDKRHPFISVLLLSHSEDISTTSDILVRTFSSFNLLVSMDMQDEICG